MSNDKKIHIFEFEAQEEETIQPEFELDKNAEFVTGFLLTSDFEALLFYRGSFKLEIGGIEYIPEKFAAKLVQCGINVAPSDRLYLIDKAPVGNGKVKIHFTDTDHSNAPFQPYIVSLYVHCSLKSH